MKWSTASLRVVLWVTLLPWRDAGTPRDRTTLEVAAPKDADEGGGGGTDAAVTLDATDLAPCSGPANAFFVDIQGSGVFGPTGPTSHTNFLGVASSRKYTNPAGGGGGLYGIANLEPISPALPLSPGAYSFESVNPDSGPATVWFQLGTNTCYPLAGTFQLFDLELGTDALISLVFLVRCPRVLDRLHPPAKLSRASRLR